MFKKLIIAGCLFAFTGVLYATSELTQVKGIKAGYCDATAAAKPEFTALKHFKYYNQVGFPTKNREIGIELPAKTMVYKLVYKMELIVKTSYMSRFGVDKTIKLYASNDNITYNLVEPCKIEFKISEIDGKKWLSIEITDFAIAAKYLKLCPRKEVKGYAGIARKFQQAFTVYKEK